MHIMRKIRGTGGRPTREESERLAEKILDVAARLMLELGYSATSIDAIAHEAGVAKRTLYDRFPQKRDLFAAVIQRRREQFLAPVAKIAASGADIETELKVIARHMLEVALDDDSIALRRLVTAEAGRFPELAAVFHDEGIVCGIKAIADILDAEVERGVLRIRDTSFAALQFLEMVLGPAHRQTMFGLTIPSCVGRRRKEYVDEVVNLFLNGCRPRGEGDAADTRVRTKTPARAHRTARA
jgi:TetR/AcrR family transcriptional repressor of mexJK operon